MGAPPLQLATLYTYVSKNTLLLVRRQHHVLGHTNSITGFWPPSAPFCSRPRPYFFFLPCAHAQTISLSLVCSSHSQLLVSGFAKGIRGRLIQPSVAYNSCARWDCHWLLIMHCYLVSTFGFTATITTNVDLLYDPPCWLINTSLVPRPRPKIGKGAWSHEDCWHSTYGDFCKCDQALSKFWAGPGDKAR